MKIIIAEDNRASRMLLEHILKLEGHEVFTAENGREALKLFKIHMPDLVCLDWMMPKMDGIETCKEIRELEKDSETKSYILMITAKSGKEDMLNALEAGVDDFITKPYESKEIISRLNIAKRMKRGASLDATDVLIDEHIALTRMANVLKEISRRIGYTPFPTKILDWCMSTPFILDSEVHHKKEDHYILAFLERAIMEHSESPKSKLFSRASLKKIDEEHKELHRLLKEMQLNIKLYKDGGEGAEIILKDEIDAYTELLKNHMNREEKFLFPISQKYLTDADVENLLSEFEKIEKGVGIEKVDKRLEQILNAEKVMKMDH